MTDRPAPMRTRPVDLRDAPAVLELVVARDVADLGAPDYSLADLESDWASGAVRLADDARVVQDGEAIVGYAIMRHSDALIIVHPDAVGQGIGSELLAWSQTRELELGRTRHRRSAAASDQAGGRLLTAAGYTKLRSYWRMRLVLEAPATPAPVPDGLSLRALDLPADAAAVHELDERSFAAVPDFTPHTFEAFREEHLAIHDLDPGLSLVAEVTSHGDGDGDGDGDGEGKGRPEGEPAGFLLSHRRPHEDTGYVALLAVGPERRHRGLGRALLTTAFAGYAAAGLGAAELGVASDNPRALALYEQAGMTPRFQIDSYERDAR